MNESLALYAMVPDAAAIGWCISSDNSFPDIMRLGVAGAMPLRLPALGSDASPPTRLAAPGVAVPLLSPLPTPIKARDSFRPPPKLPIRALCIELPPKKLVGLTFVVIDTTGPDVVGVASPDRGEATPENAPREPEKSCNARAQRMASTKTGDLVQQ